MSPLAVRMPPILGALLLAAWMFPTTALARAKFSVNAAEVRRVDDAYLLDLTIDYGLSDLAIEALDNGVPLTVEVQLQVRAADAWVWNASLIEEHLRYRIQYKPLSERYQVTQLPGKDGATFVTREAAVAALGRIHDLHLVSAKQLAPEVDYEVHVRAYLDIEELPLPLRPMAYLRPAWKLESKWTSWPLNP